MQGHNDNMIEIFLFLKVFTIPEEEQRQRYLENEIHKISLKMMEGEMVRKKYDIIHDMLKKEQIHYARQQIQLEEILSQIFC